MEPRNDLLRFRFRTLQKILFRFRLLLQFQIHTIFCTVFQLQKMCTKSCLFNVRSSIVSQKVGLSFFVLFLFLYSISCWIQIQIRFRNLNRIRNRNTFRFRSGKKFSMIEAALFARKFDYLFYFLTFFIFHFMLDSDRNLVPEPEPECIPVPDLPVPQHCLKMGSTCRRPVLYSSSILFQTYKFASKGSSESPTIHALL